MNTPQFSADGAGPKSKEYAVGATAAWFKQLTYLIGQGTPVAPRGIKTLEQLHHSLVSVDMNRPIVRLPERKLNYRFMAAEALWILGGRNGVEELAIHVPRMRTFSDDGITLAGAYGPRIAPQLDHVVNALFKDPDTRQAVLTIWTPSPAQSKDIPCTVAMSFSLRADALHNHVFMRSSDVWLGLPYDIFSFSLVAMSVLAQLNHRLLSENRTPASLGNLTISATSSHLYESNLKEASQLLHLSTRAGVIDKSPDDLDLSFFDSPGRAEDTMTGWLNLMRDGAVTHNTWPLLKDAR